MVRERRVREHRVRTPSGPGPILTKGLKFRLLILPPKEVTQRYSDGIERKHPYPNLKLKPMT